MLTLDSLRAFGANVDEGMGRCINNEAFYLRMVNSGLNDPNFDKLDKAMEENDAKAAFEAVHALKGTTGNLALTPIYEPICEMTEKLRKQSVMPDVALLYERVRSALADARKLLD